MTMTLMLLVLASVLVIRAGLDAALSYADSKVEVVAYLKVGASEERANSLRNEILKVDGVKEAAYITADEALAAFRERLKERGEPDLTGELEQNPLPASFEIALDSPSETASVADALSRLPSAALFSRIVDGRAVAESLASITSALRIAGLIVLIGFSFAVLAVVVNAIRLAPLYLRNPWCWDQHRHAEPLPCPTNRDVWNLARRGCGHGIACRVWARCTRCTTLTSWSTELITAST